MNRSDTHIPFLDSLRGFAIFAVFIFHCFYATFDFYELRWDGWFRNFNESTSFLILSPATLGWAGVSIFFVVSGFCIHLSYERSRQKNIFDFFSRRFFRIYPAYFIAVLIFSPGLLWRSSPLLSLTQLIEHLLLIHNFDQNSIFAISNSFWSIAVEFQLYLLYPVVLFFVKRLGWSKTLWIIALIEIIMRTSASVSYSSYDAISELWTQGSPFIYWFSWSIGAASANAFLNKQDLPLSKCPIFLFPVLFLISVFFKPLVNFSFLFAALSTVSIISLFLREDQKPFCIIPNFVFTHFRNVGIISYSVYLLHQPIVEYISQIVGKLLPKTDLGLAIIYLICLVSWFPILSFSRLFYRTIELPSMQMGRLMVQKS